MSHQPMEGRDRRRNARRILGAQIAKAEAAAQIEAALSLPGNARRKAVRKVMHAILGAALDGASAARARAIYKRLADLDAALTPQGA